MVNPELSTEERVADAALRPTSLSEFVGQTRVKDQLQLVLSAAKQRNASADHILLSGPPGLGKTTLAMIVAAEVGAPLRITSGPTIQHAGDLASILSSLVPGEVLFLDEIHRFSKAQQDALLPAVEAGWIVLIAATTENPSFAVNAPLLSRSLVVKLEPLAESDIADLIQRALLDPAGLSGKMRITKEAVERICQISGGDARRALTVLEAAASRSIEFSSTDEAEITLEDVLAALETALVRYDREGEQHYDTISAFIKSVRGSDPDAALHYLARMLEGGEDPRFIARRLMILASEDIGLADSSALPLAVAAFDTVANIGMPEARIALAQVTIYLALAPKSNSAYLAINAALDEVRAGFTPPIPLYLRSASSARIGSNQNYIYPHDQVNAVATQQYLSEAREYYTPKSLGQEKSLAERIEALRAIIRGKRA